MVLIKREIDGPIATITMNRPKKRNAMSDVFIEELEAAFTTLPDAVRAVILTGAAGHYCSGLDLTEHKERSAEEGIYHSRNWHRILDLIQLGGRPRRECDVWRRHWWRA